MKREGEKDEKMSVLGKYSGLNVIVIEHVIDNSIDKINQQIN